VRIDAGGIILAGRLYGRSVENGLLLVPDTGRGIDVWEDVARDLAATGLLVLTYDYPGHAGSPPVSGSFNPETLVRAAVEFLESRGAGKIAQVGDGTGGSAALIVGRLDAPVLLMGALGDQRQVAATIRLYEAARDPRTRALVPGNARGADMLRGADPGPARDVLRDFLREALAPRSARAAHP
jgi:alpha-beta hydrolase superfamily lysophospholipase